ncbi:MAG: hypothetical protein E5X58_33935, partial [Mesorhizobium sp.]
MTGPFRAAGARACLAGAGAGATLQRRCGAGAALGVRPDQPVAICVERSPAMVVGLLAILKAGG